MHEPDAPGGDHDLPAGVGDPTRRWVHPSEVGLQLRTSTDRRRGAWLAAALVTAGVGLLALGASIALDAPGTPGTRTRQDDSFAAGLASVTAVTDDGRTSGTGVVIDRDGHIVVRSAVLAGAREVWVSCGGGEPRRVEVAAQDPRSGIAVVDLPDGSGRPIIPAAEPSPGDEVLLVTAGRGESAPEVRSGVLAEDGRRLVDLLRPHRLLGVIPSGADADPGSTISTISTAGTASTTGRAGTAGTASTASTAGTTGTAGTVSTIGRAGTVSTIGRAGTVSTAGTISTAGAAGPVDGAAFDRRGRFVGLVAPRGNGGVAVIPAATVIDVAARLMG